MLEYKNTCYGISQIICWVKSYCLKSVFTNIRHIEINHWNSWYYKVRVKILYQHLTVRCALDTAFPALFVALTWISPVWLGWHWHRTNLCLSTVVLMTTLADGFNGLEPRNHTTLGCGLPDVTTTNVASSPALITTAVRGLTVGQTTSSEIYASTYTSCSRLLVLWQGLYSCICQ